MSEGWGGDAPKIHYIADGLAICGRTAPWFKPMIDDLYSPENAPRQRELYCRFCMKMRGMHMRWRSAVDDLLGQVFPDGIAAAPEQP